MEPNDLPGADPNTLPYFITEAQTRRVVPVRFEQITTSDQAELRNEDWQQAVFRDVWPNLTGNANVIADANTFKLVCLSGEDARIQGMVRVGRLTGEGELLAESLLEAAPFNRRGQITQTYRDVGRVLVARLVAESVVQGGQGRVAVVPRKGTEAFYLALGFRKRQTFRVSATDAETLLRLALLPAIGEE